MGRDREVEDHGRFGGRGLLGLVRIDPDGVDLALDRLGFLPGELQLGIPSPREDRTVTAKVEGTKEGEVLRVDNIEVQ